MMDSLERMRSARISSRGRVGRPVGRGSSRDGHSARGSSGQDPLEILEGCASQVRLCEVQAPERNLEGLGREDQRQQREHVGQAAAGAILDELVDEDIAVFLSSRWSSR